MSIIYAVYNLLSFNLYWVYFFFIVSSPLSQFLSWVLNSFIFFLQNYLL